MTDSEIMASIDPLLVSDGWAEMRKARAKTVGILVGKVLKANPKMSPALVRAEVERQLDA